MAEPDWIAEDIDAAGCGRARLGRAELVLCLGRTGAQKGPSLEGPFSRALLLVKHEAPRLPPPIASHQESGLGRSLLRSPEGGIHRPRFRRNVALHRINAKALRF